MVLWDPGEGEYEECQGKKGWELCLVVVGHLAHCYTTDILTTAHTPHYGDGVSLIHTKDEGIKEF